MTEITVAQEMLARLNADELSCYEDYKQWQDRIEDRYRSDLREAWDAYQQTVAPIRRAKQSIISALTEIKAMEPLVVMVKK